MAGLDTSLSSPRTSQVNHGPQCAACKLAFPEFRLALLDVNEELILLLL